MAKAPKTEPITLIHYTSQGGGKNKTLAKEVVQPGSPSARFLRKMEANRLAQPCYKVIDKRNSTKQHCYAYEHNKITHYLDAESVELFEELIHRNKGIYSTAIYNALTKEQIIQQMNITPPTSSVDLSVNLNVPAPEKPAPQSQQSDLSEDITSEQPEKINIDIVPFGYHLHQHEVRMNYLSNITVIVEQADDTNNLITEHSAKTIDISISGIRIKSNLNLNILSDEIVQIMFDDLYKRTTIPKEKLTYRVVDSYQDSEFIYRLERVYDAQNDDFSHALSNFIQTHKRRYKIDLEDFKASILSQVYEKIYAQSTLQIPLYFIRNLGRPFLKYVLINKALDSLTSQEKKNHIPDSRYLSFLTQKLPLEKIYLSLISKLRNEGFSTPKIVVIYTFTNNEDEYFIAYDTGKKHSKKLEMFISEAQQHESFKIWELKLRPVSMPKIDQSLDIESLSNTESDMLFNEIEDIFLSGLLMLVFDNSISEEITRETYANNDSIGDNFLNHYLLKHIKDLKVERIKTAEKIHRSENRYQLTTSVSLNFNNTSFTGHSIDFSPNGIKIQLDQALDAKLRDDIDISFISLQKKFPKEHLLNQHYRLTYLSKDKKIACFNRDHRFILHEASLFFRKIIENNQHKLTSCSSDQMMMIRSRLFERLLTHNLSTTPVFISHKNKSTHIDSIAHDDFPSSFLRFFQSQQQLNLQEIFSGSIWRDIKEHLFKSTKKITCQSGLLIILEQKHPGDIKSLFCMEENLLCPTETKKIFKELSADTHFIVKITFNPAIAYQENEIADEIHEIRLNSKVDSEHFLKRIRSIKYIADITDMTNFYIH